MHDDVIDRDTGSKRIAAIVKKGGHRPVVPDVFPDQFVELKRRHSRLEDLGNLRQGFAYQPCTIPHQLDFRRCLIMDHTKYPGSLLLQISAFPETANV